MGWRKIASTVFHFISEHPYEVNANYYSTRRGCTGIYYKDKEAVLRVCRDAKCASCGALVRDHTLS